MDSRELDVAVAEMLGITYCKHPSDNGSRCNVCGLNKSFWREVEPPAHYSTDRNHAAEMEAAIEDSGKWEAYIHHLTEIVSKDFLQDKPYKSVTQFRFRFLLTTATPQQRVRAALALQAGQEKANGK